MNFFEIFFYVFLQPCLRLLHAPCSTAVSVSFHVFPLKQYATCWWKLTGLCAWYAELQESWYQACSGYEIFECRTFFPRTFFSPVLTPPFTVWGGGAHRRSFITSTIVALVVIIEQRCRLRLPFDSSNRSAQVELKTK